MVVNMSCAWRAPGFKSWKLFSEFHPVLEGVRHADMAFVPCRNTPHEPPSVARSSHVTGPDVEPAQLDNTRNHRVEQKSGAVSAELQYSGLPCHLCARCSHCLTSATCIADW